MEAEFLENVCKPSVPEPGSELAEIGSKESKCLSVNQRVQLNPELSEGDQKKVQSIDCKKSYQPEQATQNFSKISEEPEVSAIDIKEMEGQIELNYAKQTKLPTLDQPLSHYYIKGNYNTYCIGKEMKRDDILESYRRALKDNCKCLELDLRDGPNGEVIVYHRRAPKIHIPAHEILRDCIKPNFNENDLPLILSINDNIKSKRQRNIFIVQIRTILKESIFMGDVEGLSAFPSPNQLRGKIILQAPREQWGDLANICRSTPPAYQLLETYADRLQWYEVSSLSEHKLDRYLNPTTHTTLREKKLRKLTTTMLMKNHPGSSRKLSHSFDPIPGMNAGCQIAAVDVQTKACHLAMYESKFRENGNCGYALKPAFLLDPDAPMITAKRIDVRVVEGRNIPLTNKKDLMDTFVSVSVDGVKADIKKESTKKVGSDRGNPTWSIHERLSEGARLRFDVRNPELGFLLVQVKKSAYLGLKTSTVGSYAIPIANLRKGFHRLPLHDKYLAPVKGAELVIEVLIEESFERQDGRPHDQNLQQEKSTTISCNSETNLPETTIGECRPDVTNEETKSIPTFNCLHPATSKKSTWWKSLLLGDEKAADIQTQSTAPPSTGPSLPTYNDPASDATDNKNEENFSSCKSETPTRPLDELKKENIELREKLFKFRNMKDSMEFRSWQLESDLDMIRDPAFQNYQKNHISKLRATVDILQDAAKQAAKELAIVESALIKATTELNSIDELLKEKHVKEVNDLAQIRKQKFDTIVLRKPGVEIDLNAIDSLTGLPCGSNQTTEEKRDEFERINEELKLQLAELEELTRLEKPDSNKFNQMLSSYANDLRTKERYIREHNKNILIKATELLESETKVAEIGLTAIAAATSTVDAQLRENQQIFAIEAQKRRKAEKAKTRQS